MTDIDNLYKKSILFIEHRFESSEFSIPKTMLITPILLSSGMIVIICCSFPPQPFAPEMCSIFIIKIRYFANIT